MQWAAVEPDLAPDAALTDAFAGCLPGGLSLCRRMGKAMVYPNEVVEKELAISATTRSWDTISKIREILEGS